MCAWFRPLVLVLCFNSCLFAKYGGGAGTPDAPYFISHLDDFILLSNTPSDWGKHFLQTADLDLSSTVFAGRVIGTFTGSYNGGKHLITHLSIDIDGQAYSTLGLVRTLAEGAIIQHVILKDVSMAVGSGSEMIGALVGRNLGTVYACNVQGTVSCNGKGLKIGGLVGQNEGTVVCCHTDAIVTSGTDSAQVGGLAGYSNNFLLYCSSTGAVLAGPTSIAVGGLVGTNGDWQGRVQDCFSTASVDGDFYVGGLAGMSYGGIYGITTSFSSGTVTGVEEVGGLVGRCNGNVSLSYTVSEVVGLKAAGKFAGSGGRFYSCVYCLEASPSLPAVGFNPSVDSELYGRSSSEMRDLQTFVELDWDFFGVWGFMGENHYPTLRNVPGHEWLNNAGDGSAARPYQIGSVDELLCIETILNWFDKSFVLTSDLDFDPAKTGRTTCRSSLLFPTGSESHGYGSAAFHFDGNGHTIRNLAIDVKSPYSAGAVFGIIPKGALIENLHVEECLVRGYGLVGGLVAVNCGSLSNCSFTGEVHGGDDCRYIGGLVAQHGVKSPKYVGGSIRNCSVRVAVRAGQNAGYAGGITGYNFQGAINGCIGESTIVISSGYTVGAIVGMNDAGSIDNCIGRGSIRGARVAGGIVGQNLNGFVRTCYSLAFVDGTERTGALVGDQFGGALRRSFWSVEACTLEAIGRHQSGDLVGVNALDPDSLTRKGTYVDALWDFMGEDENGRQDVWRLCVDGATPPRLAWESGVDLTCPDGISVDDLIYLADRWLESGLTPYTSADRTGDGAVNIEEYGLLAGKWLGK